MPVLAAAVLLLLQRRLLAKKGYVPVPGKGGERRPLDIGPDRIAVMNGGRIEQVDTPWALYNRPRTPFVAQFIGRTNLLSGMRTNSGLMPDAGRPRRR